MKILNGPPSVGEMIKELYLLPTGMDSDEAAKLCDIEPVTFDQIVNGQQKVGYELAYKLAKGFNTTHNFWLNIQEDYLGSKEDK